MPKLLVEFLHEQQEPFALEPYLLERRGYYSKGIINCRKTRRDLVRKCSRFVKALLLVPRTRNNNPKTKNLENGGKTNYIAQQLQEASATTLFNSCSIESDVEDEDSMKEDGTNKKLSPVSILEDQTEEADIEEGSPFHDMKEGECSTTTISECKSKQHINYVEEVGGSKNWHQFMINKRALQQKKQLLIDCVRELLLHRRRDDDDDDDDDDDNEKSGLKKIFGAEELWKIVCENVWVWSQDSIHETNIVELLRHDDHLMMMMMDQSHKHEISIEIGDAILEDIIIHELPTPIIN